MFLQVRESVLKLLCFFRYPLLVLLLALSCNTEDSNDLILNPLTMCVDHDESLAMHIHAEFIPILEHQPQLLPENIGITPDCMRPLHTHKADFRIHIESLESAAWTLGDFLGIWGKDNPYLGLGVYGVSLNNNKYEGDYHDIILKDGTSVIVDFAYR
jgi:hypothetical protein